MADIGRIVSKSSTAFKIALLGLFLTLIIHIVGYSTDSWTVIGNEIGTVKHGLWKLCVCWKMFSKRHHCICSSVPVGTGWNLDTVRAFESLGLIGIFITILFAVLGVINDEGKSWKVMSLIASFSSCVLILVGIIIYATTIAFGSYLHFSFALCTLSGCAIFVCGCLLASDKNTTLHPSGGTVIHSNTHGHVAAIQPVYPNPAYAGPQYQPGIQPPPYSQVQYYSGHSVTTVTHGQLPSAPPYAPPMPAPAQTGQPTGQNAK